MTVKIGEISIDIDPGMSIEISPDGKSIRVSSPKDSTGPYFVPYPVYPTVPYTGPYFPTYPYITTTGVIPSTNLPSITC